MIYQRRLEEKNIQNPIPDFDNVEESWPKIKTNIKSSATETRRKNKSWFTQEVKIAAKVKQDAYIRYIINRIRNL